MAERVGFEPTWRLTPPIRFRVGAVMAASVPLQAPKLYVEARLDSRKVYNPGGTKLTS